ncbi:hypothetical protein CFC21_053727 [Triticum aestivum]|uniref:GIR1-like zinc ribbon domain-containing protein n=2 Tax=Triticum aestivum TaxID=4565 RepID=A0A3B6I1Q3_WHEAT|nr:uncharacterized protein LOC123087341 [Triticum aestivum]KAF7044510.1 hypothetical protein CFC21_053727 [Triticum aestivum]
MVAEAVGFMMPRAADGGTMAPELVTRDFLGGCQAPAPAADDPRHDAAALQPGKPPLQKHLSPPPSARGDLNLFPAAGAAMAPLPTMAPAADCAATTTYHSVCTIEKVKTALERFERGKQGHHHQQQQQQQQHSGAGATAGASPSSSSVTTSSVKRRGDVAVEQGDGCDSPSASAGGGGMVAAACPRCFLYVLIARSDPRCPRCESHVPPPPAPAPKKKPRIDLNVGFLGT